MNALRHFRKRVWELEDIPENFPEPLFKRLFLLSELGKLSPAEIASLVGLTEEQVVALD